MGSSARGGLGAASTGRRVCALRCCRARVVVRGARPAPACHVLFVVQHRGGDGDNIWPRSQSGRKLSWQRRSKPVLLRLAACFAIVVGKMCDPPKGGTPQPHTKQKRQMNNVNESKPPVFPGQQQPVRCRVAPRNRLTACAALQPFTTAHSRPFFTTAHSRRRATWG